MKIVAEQILKLTNVGGLRAGGGSWTFPTFKASCDMLITSVKIQCGTGYPNDNGHYVAVVGGSRATRESNGQIYEYISNGLPVYKIGDAVTAEYLGEAGLEYRVSKYFWPTAGQTYTAAHLQYQDYTHHGISGLEYYNILDTLPNNSKSINSFYTANGGTISASLTIGSTTSTKSISNRITETSYIDIGDYSNGNIWVSVPKFKNTASEYNTFTFDKLYVSKDTELKFNLKNTTYNNCLCLNEGSTVTVTYIPAEYNVALNSGAGISSVDGAGTYTSGSSVTVSASPLTGYHFTSWSNGVTSNPYTFTISGNVSLTAYGAANTNTAYKVEHYTQNINSDTYALVNTDNLTGTTGASITPSVKSYTGFTSPATTTTTIAADGSTVVKYYYSRNSYNVALEKNTGISSAIGGGSKEYGSSVTINAESANGYNFLEWTTSSSGVNNSTSNPHTFTMPANAVTYAANASPIEYIIEYNLNGGEVAIANPNSYTIESPDITLNEPTKIGYTFIGWTDSNDSPPQTAVTIAKGSIGNKSYTANWKLDFYAYMKQPDGSWKQTEVYIKQDGTWKKCEVYVKDNNEWLKSVHKDL